jgi:aminoglycoside/choline kinase family phosphotransferase
LGLNAPEVLAADLDQGLLLLTDLGSRQYLAELDEHSVAGCMMMRWTALARLQVGGDPDSALLPPYDSALLHREMELFREWFLGPPARSGFERGRAAHARSEFRRPGGQCPGTARVWVHRDYHSRNLMVTEAG